MRLVTCDIDLGADCPAATSTAAVEAAQRPAVAVVASAHGMSLVGAPDAVIESALDAIVAAGLACAFEVGALGDAPEQDARLVCTAISEALRAVGPPVAASDGTARRSAVRDPLKACEPFLDAVAAAAPLPGGGSASAMAGAAGVALVAMVAGLTVGRAAYADVNTEMAQALEAAEMLRERLHGMIRLDADAYAAFMTAVRLPRDTDAAAAERRAAMSAAAVLASEIPLETMRLCADALDVACEVARKGNRNAATDAAVGAMLLGTAGRAACRNVRVNLPSVKDLDTRGRLSGDAQALVRRIDETEARAVRHAEMHTS